jgi:DinB superfamily
MDALEFFLPQHARLYGADLGDPRSVWDRMLEGLSDQQIRLRPARGVNSIAWIVWPTARVEDVAVNLVVAADRQILDDAWAARLGLTGATSAWAHS